MEGDGEEEALAELGEGEGGDDDGGEEQLTDAAARADELGAEEVELRDGEERQEEVPAKRAGEMRVAKSVAACVRKM